MPSTLFTFLETFGKLASAGCIVIGNHPTYGVEKKIAFRLNVTDFFG